MTVPRFFFDIHDGARDDDHDVACADLDDAESARRTAIATLVDVARESLPDGDRHVFRACVRDEAGRLIYETALTLDGSWLA